MTISSNQQALNDVVVIQFAAFAAGPCVGKYMANHGAFVVKVESRSRPDGFRGHYPPFKDNIKGVNRSGVFSINNDGVHSLGINLKSERGGEIARQLAAKADVLIENFTPGTMNRLGLGWERLREINPRLVMLSTCNLGQNGPRAQQPGFGSQLTSLSGFTHLIGKADRNPVIAYGPYIDYIAVGFGYIAILAALEARRVSGRGQYIDLSQYESGIHFITPGILQQQLLGSSPSRCGNQDPEAAPHGVYPCAEPDSWCAISVHDDAEWLRLVHAMGNPAWAGSSQFTTAPGRKAREANLDAQIASWVRPQNASALMLKLQTARVHAAKVNNVAELFSDPQLAHRRYWREVPHAEMGPHHVEAPAFNLSATPCGEFTPPPLLNEHTEYVLQKLLGFSPSQIEELAAQGAVELAERQPSPASAS